jgi:uncharacterized protein YfaS (alpha-2-macroglobulin family)
MSQPRTHAPRRDWKDAVIFTLAALVLVLAAAVARGRLPSLGAEGGGGLPVGVFDVVLDRESLSAIDIQFDLPLGQGKEGAILADAPATLSPAAGGVWKWKDAQTLRFEASDRLEMATVYTIALIPERLLAPGQKLTGKRSLTVKTDQFKIDRVELFEEPVPDAKATVTFRGQLRFNYAVNPEQLAGRIRVLDPSTSTPIEVAIETSWWSEVIGIRTGSLVKAPEAREPILEIDGTLTPARGNVPLGERFRHPIPLGSSTRLAVRSVSAVPGEESSTIRILLSSPADAARSPRFVSIEPAVEARFAADRNSLDLTGAFEPGKRYQIALAKGLPSTDDATLPEPAKLTVTVPDLEPKLDFQSPGMFLARSGFHAVAIESINVDSANLVVDRVYRNNLFSLVQFQSWEFEREEYWSSYLSSSLGDRLADQTIRLRTQRNRTVVTAVDLDRYVAKEKPGLYRIALTSPGEYSGSQRWVLITDLGLIAKRGLDGDGASLDVWAISFSTLEPIAGARVRVISAQNQLLAEGTTDAGGAWQASGLPTADRNDAPLYVTIERGDDFSFLLFDRSRIDTTGLDVDGAMLSAGGYTAFLYGERNLYRPGETARGVALVRDRRQGIPPAMPLVLRHLDPDGRPRGEQKLAADRRGIAELSLELPAYTPTGHHTLELAAGDEVIGTYHFQVEEFVPDRIKVEITPSARDVGPGEKLDWTVGSQYLFGPPAAGLPVETRVRLVPVPFAPEGFAGFSFGDPERDFPPREEANLSDTLDEEGRHQFSLTLPSRLEPPAALEVQITARVQEQAGRGVAALARLRHHPVPYYLGLKAAREEFGEPGKPVNLDWVAVRPDGKPASAATLRAELYRDEYHTVLRRSSDGTWRYESTRNPVLVDTQTPTAGERGTLTFTPQQYGAYRAVLADTGTGARSVLSFYVAGWGYSPWALASPAKVELSLDKSEYRGGETARLLIKAPFAGRALVTVERERVLWSQQVTISGNTAEVTLPVRAEYRPNAYVSVVLVRGSDTLEPGGVARAFGSIPLDVDRSANRLAVNVQAPEESRPEQPLAVSVETAPGATVTIAAVDEGILQLIAQKTPDPFAHFYAKLALRIDAFDLFSQLFPEVDPKRFPAGGGEDLAGMAQFLRTEGIRRVQPVAFWSGVVTAGADGVATARFDVPEFQGALRIMAVASDVDRFGAAEKKVRIRTPLVVLPTFPRFLAHGDVAKVPVGVRNDTGQRAAIAVELQAEGAAQVGEPSRQTVEIDHGREQTVFFTVTTPATGQAAKLTAAASGGGERTRSRADLPVLPSLPAQTVERAGRLEQAATTLPEDFAAGLRSEGLDRELRIGPLPVLSLSGKLADLLRYPYGCAEQTASRGFPLLYLDELARTLEPELLAKNDPARLVQEALRRLATMQTYDGGFSMWPGGEEPEPWASLYATHFVVEARRAGHPVDGYLHDRAVEWAGREVQADNEASGLAIERTVYALYVLARAGQADLGSMDFVRDQLTKELRPDQRALLAAAYAAVGNPRAVTELLAGLGQVEAIDRQTGGNLDSTIRRRALVLLGLLDAAPDHLRIPELAERLLRDAELEGWWTTQETAFALLAVGQLAKRQAATATWTGKVLVGGQTVAKLDAKPRLVRLPAAGAIRIEMDPGYQPGAAFYSLRARGIPTDAAYQPQSAGLELERKVYRRAGGEADLGAIAQGELLVWTTRVRSISGALENVVIETVLPSGLEVENPRLASSEQMPELECLASPRAMDVRDDRVLVFTDLAADTWVTSCVLVRAVTPGTFRLPPAQVEAMYDPAKRASGPRGEMVVE